MATIEDVPPPNLTTLPDEILSSIISCLDSPTAVLNLGATARRFLVLSHEPLLWKRFCLESFRYWDYATLEPSVRRVLRRLNTGLLPSSSSSSDPDVDVKWRQIFVARHAISVRTRDTLDEVVRDPRGRADRIREVVGQGYNAKDVLRAAFVESPRSRYHLAQRYWSHVALGCLHRTAALKEWSALAAAAATTTTTTITEQQENNSSVNDDEANNEEEEVERTVRALAGLDMFVLDSRRDRGDVDDILERLQHYVAQIRADCPDMDDQTPRQKAVTIAGRLRAHRWVGIDQGREYHSLDNMFLGVALFSEHNNSLPLVSAVIYSYVARRFGLRAQPVSYPMHVHVLVQAPPGIDLDGRPLLADDDDGNDDDEVSDRNDPFNYTHKTHIYMDPFNNADPVPIPMLRVHLSFIVNSATRDQMAQFLAPASARDLLVRSAHNILHTRNVVGGGGGGGRNGHQTGGVAISPEAAMYAALFVLVLFPNPNPNPNLRTHLTELTQHLLHHYDYDLHIFRTFILPLTAGLPDHLAYRNLALQLDRGDREDATPKSRSLVNSGATGENPVRFRVGQLFRHRLRNYLALIYGWDPSCEMTPQWIAMNQVDRLPRGRDQPFYNVLVIDDRSTRYVAEENVVLLGPPGEGGNGETATLEQVLDWPIEIGKWMKRFDVNEDGVGWQFVSNVRDQYPED